MTAAMLKPDESAAALIELLREERLANAELAAQIQTVPSPETVTVTLSETDRAALIDDLVTRSSGADLTGVAAEFSVADEQQTSDILASAIAQQGQNATAIEQLAGSYPCIDELKLLVQTARISFDVSAVAPSPSQLESARQIADIAVTCPTVMIAVEGHTDPSGNEVENLLMSWKRAESTIQALAAEGYDVSRFEPLGFGSRHLASQGTDFEAAALNRRVQFHLAPMPGQ